jgi:hypothetical protein
MVDRHAALKALCGARGCGLCVAAEHREHGSGGIGLHAARREPTAGARAAAYRHSAVANYKALRMILTSPDPPSSGPPRHPKASVLRALPLAAAGRHTTPSDAYSMRR